MPCFRCQVNGSVMCNGPCGLCGADCAGITSTPSAGKRLQDPCIAASPAAPLGDFEQNGDDHGSQ